MEFIVRQTSYNELLTYLMIGSIAIITCIKLIYNIQFNDFLGTLTNGKYFLLHNKSDKKKNLFNQLFYVFFAINLTVFSYTVVTSLDLFVSKNSYTLILCAIFINIYFISKYLIEKILFEVLDLEFVFDTLNFQRSTFINFIGILLLLINLSTLYIATSLSDIFIYCCLGILFLTYVFSVIVIVINNQNVFLKHWFYFILYLCALEISPFLIGGVLILTNVLK